MLWEKLKNTNKPILLYGMGNGAEKILDRLELLGITPAGVFASDGFARHNLFRGYTVISYSEAKAKYGDFIALISFGSQRPEVLELFRRMLDEIEVCAPDVPVYGDTIFDKNYAKEHEKRLLRVYDALCDEQSKKVFENTVRYKLTGNIRYLFDCETSPDEAYARILKPTDGEIFMDLGAYNGDTVAEFLGKVSSYRKIIAVEPDRKTFRKLEANTKDLQNILRLNVGIGDKTEMLPFTMSGGRNSALGAGDAILCRSVDDILLGDSVTFIKMDVEGMEKKAILGAKKTILREKPKLLVSAYHRSEDIFDLPETVFSVRDDYKLYMRHHPYVPAWDTNYYFV